MIMIIPYIVYKIFFLRVNPQRIYLHRRFIHRPRCPAAPRAIFTTIMLFRAALTLLLVSSAAGLRVAPAGLRVAPAVGRARCAPRSGVAPPVMADRPPRDSNAGFYARPSSAVEKGGQFFVPGLEGFRIKLLASVMLIVAIAANRVLSPGTPASSQLVSEVLSVLSCTLLLVQVGAEIEAERAIEREGARAFASARNAERLELDPALSADRSSRVQWAAATLLRLTPASIIALYSVAAPTGDATPLLRSGRLPASAVSPTSSALLEQLAAGGGDLRYLLEVDGAEALRLPPTAGSAVLARCGDACVLVAVSELSDGFSVNQRLWISRVSALL